VQAGCAAAARAADAAAGHQGGTRRQQMMDLHAVESHADRPLFNTLPISL
jgi:hypothetical protein